MSWRFIKDVSVQTVMAVASTIAAVFLAYSNLTEANAVQDVKIDIHDRALITLKEDLLRELSRMNAELVEIRKNQERDR